MKKLLVTASSWRHISSFHLPYLQEFQRCGWEVHVGCRGIPANAPFVDRGIELPFEKRLTAFSNFQIARSLRQRIQSERYDLIITHTSLAAFFTRLALKGRKPRPGLVNVVHGYLFDGETPLLKRTLLLGAERLTAPETDLLLTMNAWDNQEAKRYRLGKRIETIPGMGVDFAGLDAEAKADDGRLRETLGIPTDAFVLLYPAEFSRRKSQRVLIEAMPYLPQTVWLVLCGDGELLETCKALAERLNVRERVLFPGQVGEIARWYRMADTLAASSRSEGLPFNLMEAMHMGLPVIASAVKGHADLVRDGENGLLYPYGNARELAGCVRRLLCDAPLRERLGREGRAQSGVYSLETVKPAVMSQYLENMGDRLGEVMYGSRSE